MKKNLLIAVSFALFASSAALAQKDDKKPALITLTAGWSHADLIQGNETTDKRTGFFAGVRKDVKLIPGLHIESGLLYVQKGAQFTTPNLESVEYKLDYLDIPLAIKGVIGPVYGIAGLSGNIRISSKVDDEDLDGVKGFDLTSSIGFGVKILMFSVDLRWNRSLGDILEDNPGDKLMNDYLLLGIGFGIHRK